MGTRERILDAAVNVLRRSGLAGASLGEVLAESGAPKGSLYHYFPEGKQQVVRDALAVYGARVRDYIAVTLAPGARPSDKVRALFAAVAGRLESGGFGESCAGGTVSLDLGAPDERVRADVAREFASWIDLITHHVAIPDPARRRAFAGLVLTAIEGGYVRGRAEHSTRALLEAADWLAPLADREAGIDAQDTRSSRSAIEEAP
jgi:TetR/AcrR family transcriptional repressor of lmrAB and yxaGH operons